MKYSSYRNNLNNILCFLFRLLEISFHIPCFILDNYFSLNYIRAIIMTKIFIFVIKKLHLSIVLYSLNRFYVLYVIRMKYK